MGLDGFSMGNLGIQTDMTAAQVSTQIEHITQKEAEIMIKDISNLDEGPGIKRKKKDDESNQEFNDGFLKRKKNENESEDDEDDDSESSILNEKFFENADLKEFTIRVNPHSQMVELYSNKEARVLETISPNDLMAVISKLTSASGILVNRKI